MKMRPAASNPSLLELRPGGLRDAVSQRASTPPRLGGSSQYGLACDNLLSVEIVTADGELRTANATENADLFWGVRGGGGNFGAVTSFRFRLYPVGQVLGGRVIHPLSKAKEVLRFHREFTRHCPDELTVYAGILNGPEDRPVVALAIC